MGNLSSLADDSYTPFGLLDNPWHTWKLSRLGVFRTNGALGIDWLLPNSQSPWVTLSARIFFKRGAQWLSAEELRSGTSSPATAQYHSKNLVALTLGRCADPLIEWFPAAKGVLGFRLRPMGLGFDGLRLLLEAVGETRQGLWEFGWCARCLSDRSVCIRSYAEGPVFVAAVSKPAAILIGHERAELRSEILTAESKEWAASKEGVRAAFTWPADDSARWVEGVVAFGWDLESVSALANENLNRISSLRAQRLDEDDRFWSSASRLDGDWPAHWRRGWVYDFETLRMTVRQPIGVFRGCWDGMQVQKPRLVLAETALDAWTLALAQPNLAKEIVSTCFESAPKPNVPCIREDGSTNMVAEDGSECGTGPNWCLPFTAIREIYGISRDRVWLRRLLPRLEAYVDWWLRHRTDNEGFGHFKCSWESGQDSSPRFRTPQPTGGESVEHLRAVDLQAGLLDAVRTLVFLRRELGIDAGPWLRLSRRLRALLRRMWQGDGFYDYDCRDNVWANADDLACLTPFAVARWPHSWSDAARLRLQSFAEAKRFWLEWPSFWLIFAEAARRVGARDLLLETLAWRVDSVYSAWDARQWSGTTPVPGTAAECWGLDSPRGAEGYGWGATLPLHILRGFLGFRYRCGGVHQEVVLRPMLPWRTGSYAVRNLPVHGGRVDIRIERRGGGRLSAEISRTEGEIRLSPVYACVSEGEQRIVSEIPHGSSLSFRVIPSAGSGGRSAAGC